MDDILSKPLNREGPGESLTASGGVKADGSIIADGGPGAMPLDHQQKFQVILAQLQERYDAAHKMRARGVQFTLWISGLAVGLSWILINKGPLPLTQQVGVTMLAAALAFGAIYFLSALAKGFHKNRQAMIRLESALGLHSEGVFTSQGVILPPDYRNAKRRWSDHFNSLMVWLAVVALALGVLIWSGPGLELAKQPPIKTEQIQMGE